MKLYVGNLSFNTTDPDLKDLFSQYGTVTDVHLVTDRMTGKSRGFAFVTMSSAPEGNAAISALEGKNFDGRNLTVNEARPRDEGPKRASSKSLRHRSVPLLSLIWSSRPMIPKRNRQLLLLRPRSACVTGFATNKPIR